VPPLLTLTALYVGAVSDSASPSSYFPIIQYPVVGICFVLDDAIFWTWTFEFADMQAVMSWS